MKKYCQNPLCENPAVKQVATSVNRYADQRRWLCAACEEAYTWGLQHGLNAAELWLPDYRLAKARDAAERRKARRRNSQTPKLPNS